MHDGRDTELCFGRISVRNCSCWIHWRHGARQHAYGIDFFSRVDFHRAEQPRGARAACTQPMTQPELGRSERGQFASSGSSRHSFVADALQLIMSIINVDHVRHDDPVSWKRRRCARPGGHHFVDHVKTIAS